jgi:hypothetical protein
MTARFAAFLVSRRLCRSASLANLDEIVFWGLPMLRYLLATLLAVLIGAAASQAQETVKAPCATCTDCVRITEVRKTQVPVYSCKVKEICVPACGLIGHFLGAGDCKKIEIRQLVKSYRTEEVCVTKCVTMAEAIKHYQAEAKKAAATSFAPATPRAGMPANAAEADFAFAPSVFGAWNLGAPDGPAFLPKE